MLLLRFVHGAILQAPPSWWLGWLGNHQTKNPVRGKPNLVFDKQGPFLLRSSEAGGKQRGAPCNFVQASESCHSPSLTTAPRSTANAAVGCQPEAFGKVAAEHIAEYGEGALVDTFDTSQVKRRAKIKSQWLPRRFVCGSPREVSKGTKRGQLGNPFCGSTRRRGFPKKGHSVDNRLYDV